MSKLKIAAGALAASLLLGSVALADANNHMAMASSADHAKMTKMDVMMVKNCKAMSHDKMMADKECQDYMKHHPDWMKHTK